MKKALLVDVDSKIQNYVIMKLSTHFKSQGYIVVVKKLKYSGYPHHKREQTVIDAKEYDVVYVSIIFTSNKHVVKVINCDNVFFGGTGYDLKIKIPQYIDDCDPDYSIYPEFDETIGFLTRGCIRNCYFCFVPEKEGYLHAYWDLDRIVRNSPHKKVRFLDNNFLAWKNAEEVMLRLINSDIPCSFNEGLDIRLIDDDKARLLSMLHYYPNEYVFAFDDIRLIDIIETNTKILKKYIKNNWKLKYYIYTNAEMPLEDVVKRISWCREHKVLPYIMRDANCYTSEHKDFYTDLTSWCNQVGIFKKMDFKSFMGKRTKNEARRKRSIGLYLENIK